MMRGEIVMNKKRLLNKVTAAIAVVMLMVGMISSTVMAFPTDADAKASITVHKFSRTTAAAGENSTGEVIADTSGLGIPLAGAGFTLYPITMPTLDADENYTGTYTINVAAGTVTFDTEKAGVAGTKVGTLGTASTEKVTANDGTTKFEDLDQGHYVLEETTVPAGYSKSPDTVISLPMTLASGEGFNYDVHVYPKNISTVPITKILDDVTKAYKVGDEVDFTINAGISNTETEDSNKVSSVEDLKDGAAYGAMKILDTLVAGLDYVSSEVSLLTADNSRVPLTENVDYTLVGDDTGELVWELTTDGIDKAIANGAVAVEVKLTTEIVASVEALSNAASSFVKKANGEDPTDPPITPPVVVPTGNVEVYKVDENDEALAGAQFALIVGDSTTAFLLPDGTTKTITDYTTLLDDDEIVKGTTDEDGYLIFAGLDYNFDDGSEYKLVEIKAPDGYQLKEAVITADLEAGNTDLNVVTSVTVKNYPNGTVDPDNPKFSLPLTGGMGTMLFTFIGIIVMAVVATIYIQLKRKNRI